MKKGFRGVFFWQIHGDRLPDGSNPLQEASRRGVGPGLEGAAIAGAHEPRGASGHGDVNISRLTSASEAQPVSASARSRSAIRLASTSWTPRSPPTARP